MPQNIPYITLTGKSAPRSNENIVDMNCATAIIRNKDTGLYFALEFMNQGVGLAGGRVESGESKEQTIIREVEEEAGYTNAEIVDVIFEEAYSRGYKARKDQEEEARDKVFFVEVEENNHVGISGADFGTQNSFWFTAEQMLERLTLDHHLYFFKEYLKQ